MAQREWVEKDFYKELGVASDAGQDEIKRAARKILAENHPDRNPGNSVAEERYKAASEAGLVTRYFQQTGQGGWKEAG